MGVSGLTELLIGLALIVIGRRVIKKLKQRKNGSIR